MRNVWLLGSELGETENFHITKLTLNLEFETRDVDPDEITDFADKWMQKFPDTNMERSETNLF